MLLLFLCFCCYYILCKHLQIGVIAHRRIVCHTSLYVNILLPSTAVKTLSVTSRRHDIVHNHQFCFITTLNVEMYFMKNIILSAIFSDDLVVLKQTPFLRL